MALRRPGTSTSRARASPRSAWPCAPATRSRAPIVGERWEDGVGYVAELAVDGRARGQGLGRALVVALLAAFADAGLRTAELSVRADNTAARALYASVGFVADFRQERWVRT